MAATKMTFTLDAETAARIERIAARLGASKSGVVREAVREYALQVGRLSDDERGRLLAAFDDLVPSIPRRPAAAADREIAEVRAARRRGGRRSSG